MSTYFYSNVIWLESGYKMSPLGLNVTMSLFSYIFQLTVVEEIISSQNYLHLLTYQQIEARVISKFEFQVVYPN